MKLFFNKIINSTKNLIKDNKIKRFAVMLLNNNNLKKKLYTIIFESDTKAGKFFDTILILMILLSIIVLIIESLQGISQNFKMVFKILEYIFTGFFTLEYITRIYCSPQPRKYIFSFFGIIDLLATLPVYIGFLMPGARYLLVIRVFRLIRVFRVFKLFHFLNEGHYLLLALKDSSKKIVVFFLFVLILVISIGTIMYMIEGNQPDTQFNNILTSIYWAIVTMTTVGYGDITPVTTVGRFLSAFVMLIGYTIIAVPTGIVSASMVKSYQNHSKSKIHVCQNCNQIEYDEDAVFCKYCGCELAKEKNNNQEDVVC